MNSIMRAAMCSSVAACRQVGSWTVGIRVRWPDAAASPAPARKVVLGRFDACRSGAGRSRSAGARGRTGSPAGQRGTTSGRKSSLVRAPCALAKRRSASYPAWVSPRYGPRTRCTPRQSRHCSRVQALPDEVEEVMVIGHTPVSKGSFSCSPSRVTCALASLEADGGGWADIRPGQRSDSPHSSSPAT
jgi:hypothetical protein